MSGKSSSPFISTSNHFDLSLCFTLSDNMREGAVILEAVSKKVVYCNESYLKLFGVNSIKKVDIKLLEKLGKDTITAKIITGFKKTPGNKKIYYELVEFKSLSGVTFFAEATVRLYNIRGVDYYLFIVIPVDNAFFEIASMGMLMVNNTGDIVAINSCALKQFGYEKKEVLGKKIELFIPPGFHSKHIQYRKRFTRHSPNRPMGSGMDLFGVKKNGTDFPVEISLGSYCTDGHKYTIAYINDISVRKQAEAALKSLNTELESKVELRTKDLKEALRQLEIVLEREKELGELKSRFVSMASHEFRTPLSTILSSAYLIEKYGTEGEQPKREKHLHHIISAVNMLTETLNDFLSVGKIEEGKIHARYAQFDITELVKSVTMEFMSILKGKQEIKYEHEGNREVLLDPSLVKHILMNLFSNASKFSAEDSLIEVRTNCSKDRVILSVKDHGIGISMNDQRHLMERFFRGTNAVNIEGSGLGLHIVAKFAELMNGMVQCNSELEKGTEFIVSFNIKTS